MIRAGAALLALCAAAGCSKDEANKPKPEPAKPEAARPATTGDIAVVNVEGKLLAVSMTGATKPYAIDGDATWCATDNKARVIWYATADALRYIDLADGTSHVAIESIGGEAMIRIDHGGGAFVGVYDELSPDVALVLTLSATPSVDAKLLCDGDARWYCYEDDGNDDIDDDPLNQELVAKREKFDALEPADASALAALAARGKDRKLWLEPSKGDGPATVAVDHDNCRDYTDGCGEVHVLPSTPPIWSVTIANDRGDYYHELYQLYDPSAKQFFLANAPSKRSPKPLPDDWTVGVEGLLVAPSGKAYLHRDTIATWDEVVWHVPDALPCGWLGPVYRVPGPRG